MAFVFEVDETGKPISMERRLVPITPVLDPERLAIRLTEYGADYLATLRAIEEDDEALRDQGRVPAARPERVTVARLDCDGFGIELQSAWPGGGDYATHWAVLTVDGQPTTAVCCLYHATGLTPDLRESLVTITRWGWVDMGGDGEDGAEYVVTALVDAGCPDLIRALPELARWVRADGRHVEQIAEDYRAAVQREEEEERLRRARWDDSDKAA